MLRKFQNRGEAENQALQTLGLISSFEEHSNKLSRCTVIATDYRLDFRGVGIRIPIRSRIFPFHFGQTGCEAHPASYPISIVGSFPRGNDAVRLKQLSTRRTLHFRDILFL
jgi:hypothetical protein